MANDLIEVSPVATAYDAWHVAALSLRALAMHLLDDANDLEGDSVSWNELNQNGRVLRLTQACNVTGVSVLALLEALRAHDLESVALSDDTDAGER